MKPLSIDRAGDGNLKPVKDSDGTLTALELSTDTVKVKDLVVSGTTTGVIATDDTKLPLSGGAMTGALTMGSGVKLQFVDGDEFISGDGTDLTISSGGLITLDSVDGHVRFKQAGDADDFAVIGVSDDTGATTFATTSAGADGHLRLYPDGDLILQSATGNFISRTISGTEFSAANSAYAGMMIGCTHVFGSGTGGQFVQTSTAWENLLWDTDKYALVTFVVPPSNKVKISVHIPYVGAASYQVQLGLATDSSASTLHTKYENDVDDANRQDSFNLNYSWVVEGSDHSWSAGDTETLYIMAYAASNMRVYTGGTDTSFYGGVIVEATALPATIGDGSEP